MNNSINHNFFLHLCSQKHTHNIMTRLLLMRHGETIDNARQLMQGQVQGELNDNGRRQAQEACRRMENESIDVFVASDLQRSVDTARIMAEPHRKNVITTPLLRERDWGDFTGRYIPDLKGLPWPDNVEKLTHLLARAQSFLHYIYNMYPGKTVLAVGHGIINKAIQAVYRDCDMRDVTRMDNAEIRLLELTHDYSEKQPAELANDKKFSIT